MKIRVPIIPIQTIIGQLGIHSAPDAANDYWIHAGRLKDEGKLVIN